MSICNAGFRNCYGGCKVILFLFFYFINALGIIKNYIYFCS